MRQVVIVLSHAKVARPVAPYHSNVHAHGYRLISPNKTNMKRARIFEINCLFTSHLRKEIKVLRGGEHCLRYLYFIFFHFPLFRARVIDMCYLDRLTKISSNLIWDEAGVLIAKFLP